MEFICQMFSYGFMVKAFVCGICLSIASGLLGIPLVFRRMSMAGDGLSHVGFGSLACAAALNQTPYAIALPVVIAVAVVLLFLGERNLLRGDAAIALLSTTSLAVGVTVLSLTNGMNTEVNNFLFGSILGLDDNDVTLTVSLSIVMFILFILLRRSIFAVTFDEPFARASGKKVRLIKLLVAVMTALIIVLGMRMMGALLISSLMVMPVLTASRLCCSFSSLILRVPLISVVTFSCGLTVSYAADTPAGASVVLCNVAVLLAVYLYASLRRLN